MKLFVAVCGPLGLDFAVGLDAAQQARAVKLTGLDEQFRAANASGRPKLYRRALASPLSTATALDFRGVGGLWSTLTAVHQKSTVTFFGASLADGNEVVLSLACPKSADVLCREGVKYPDVLPGSHIRRED